MKYNRKVIFPFIVLGGSALLYACLSLLDREDKTVFWLVTLLNVILAWWFGNEYDNVKGESEKDSLTQAYNRRIVYRIFPKLTNLANKHEQKVAVFFIDVDNFKMINDTYGHYMGDILLQRIATTLQELVGKKNYVVRWGGDEFLVLLQCSDAFGIDALHNHLLDRLCRKVDEIPVKVTFSIGCAIYPDEGSHIQEILYTADKNMYQQKNKEFSNS